MMMRLIKALGALRYPAAVSLFIAVFYVAYHGEPTRAAFCIGGTITYEGPNSGHFDTQSECEESFVEDIEDQVEEDCTDLCGSGYFYDEGSAWTQCCPVAPEGFEFGMGGAHCLLIE
jgi:hypothetical protein